MKWHSSKLQHNLKFFLSSPEFPICPANAAFSRAVRDTTQFSTQKATKMSLKDHEYLSSSSKERQEMLQHCCYLPLSNISLLSPDNSRTRKTRDRVVISWKEADVHPNTQSKDPKIWTLLLSKAQTLTCLHIGSCFVSQGSRNTWQSCWWW